MAILLEGLCSGGKGTTAGNGDAKNPVAYLEYLREQLRGEVTGRKSELAGLCQRVEKAYEAAQGQAGETYAFYAGMKPAEIKNRAEDTRYRKENLTPGDDATTYIFKVAHEMKERGALYSVEELEDARTHLKDSYQQAKSQTGNDQRKIKELLSIYRSALASNQRHLKNSKAVEAAYKRGMTGSQNHLKNARAIEGRTLSEILFEASMDTSQRLRLAKAWMFSHAPGVYTENAAELVQEIEDKISFFAERRLNSKEKNLYQGLQEELGEMKQRVLDWRTLLQECYREVSQRLAEVKIRETPRPPVAKDGAAKEEVIPPVAAEPQSETALPKPGTAPEPVSASVPIPETLSPAKAAPEDSHPLPLGSRDSRVGYDHQRVSVAESRSPAEGGINRGEIKGETKDEQSAVREPVAGEPAAGDLIAGEPAAAEPFVPVPSEPITEYVPAARSRDTLRGIPAQRVELVSGEAKPKDQGEELPRHYRSVEQRERRDHYLREPSERTTPLETRVRKGVIAGLNRERVETAPQTHDGRVYRTEPPEQSNNPQLVLVPPPVPTTSAYSPKPIATDSRERDLYEETTQRFRRPGFFTRVGVAAGGAVLALGLGLGAYFGFKKLSGEAPQSPEVVQVEQYAPNTGVTKTQFGQGKAPEGGAPEIQIVLPDEVEMADKTIIPQTTTPPNANAITPNVNTITPNAITDNANAISPSAPLAHAPAASTPTVPVPAAAAPATEPAKPTMESTLGLTPHQQQVHDMITNGFRRPDGSAVRPADHYVRSLFGTPRDGIITNQEIINQAYKMKNQLGEEGVWHFSSSCLGLSLQDLIKEGRGSVATPETLARLVQQDRPEHCSVPGFWEAQ